MVAVAAILVASIRLGFIDTEPMARELGPARREMDVRLRKGAEMGWFEHGSTIILFMPAGVTLDTRLAEGQQIRAGQRLMQLSG